MRVLLSVFLLSFVSCTYASTLNVTVTLSQKKQIVGQVNYIKVSVLVPTWLTKPLYFNEIDAVNLISVNTNKSAYPISNKVNGTTWSGVMKEYAVVPMAAGNYSITIPAITVHYMGENKQNLTHKIPPQQVQIQAVIPKVAKQLVPLIIAEDIILEDVVQAPEPLIKGSVLTRKVTVKVSGTSGLFIPPLLSDGSTPSLKRYTMSNHVDDNLNARKGELLSTVTQSQNIMLLQTGDSKFENIEIRYYQPSSDSIKTVSSKKHHLVVKKAPLTKQQKWALSLVIISLLIIVFVSRKQLLSLYLSTLCLIKNSEWYLFHKTRKTLKQNPVDAYDLYFAWQNHWQKEIEENSLVSQNAVLFQTALDEARYFNKHPDQLDKHFMQLRLRLKQAANTNKARLNSLNP
ncbi:hypothetical protein AAEU29_12165 [Pseudoalteromonas sp. SSM20]|uniref:hypothetical protein n=1 Tax=Pseudoalteromonas sp. SSM20 TaxID=3139394 RepID=UPI003BAC336D